ncbi:MAG: hypothetical protein ACRD6N_18790, partial [Pyrinomonadaceae bacterium]
MAKTAMALGVVTLLLCFGLQRQMANSARTSHVSQAPSATHAKYASLDFVDAEIPVNQARAHDISDSDEFLQRTINATGPERDNTQKIEALLKR